MEEKYLVKMTFQTFQYAEIKRFLSSKLTNKLHSSKTYVPHGSTPLDWIYARMKILFTLLVLLLGIVNSMLCEITISTELRVTFPPCALWKMTWLEPMSYQLSTTRGQYLAMVVWREWRDDVTLCDCKSFQWNQRLFQLAWHVFQVGWPSLPVPTARKNTADMYN